ncbi:MAG: hypothetical protein RLZZ599_1205 [Bacteroidota bacterium]|jgi:hypothetical protein
MNTRLLLGTLGIFTTLILLAYSCSSDRSYRDEYIQLLEEKLANQSLPESLEVSTELTEEDVRIQTLDLLSFACGSSSQISDVRVRKSAQDKWSVLVVLSSDSIDQYGFEVYDKIFLTGVVNGDILEFKNLEELIEICE